MSRVTLRFEMATRRRTRMAPTGPTTGYEALLADGRIRPGSGRTPDEALSVLDRAIPADNGPSLSDELAALREGERVPISGSRTPSS